MGALIDITQCPHRTAHKTNKTLSISEKLDIVKLNYWLCIEDDEKLAAIRQIT